MSHDPRNHLKLLDEEDFRACVRYNKSFLRVSQEGVQVRGLAHVDRVGGLELKPDEDGLQKAILRQRGKFVLTFPFSIADLLRLAKGPLGDLIYSIDVDELSLTIEANRFDEDAPPIELGKAPSTAPPEQLAELFGGKAVRHESNESASLTVKWTPERIDAAHKMIADLKAKRVRDFMQQTAGYFGVSIARLQQVLKKGAQPSTNASPGGRIYRQLK